MFKVENGILTAKKALLDLKEAVEATEPMEVDASEQNGEQPQADENASAGEVGWRKKIQLFFSPVCINLAPSINYPNFLFFIFYQRWAF